MKININERGLAYLAGNSRDQATMKQEVHPDETLVEYVDYFDERHVKYAKVEELRNDLGLLALVSDHFEPRDLACFILVICQRAFFLSHNTILNEAKNIEHLLNPTIRTTNIGTLSIRGLVLSEIELDLKRLADLGERTLR